MKNIYNNYSEVPFYRKESVNTVFLYLSFIFPVTIFFVLTMLITGGIYSLSKENKVVPWSRANTVLAWILFVVPWLIFCLFLISNKK